MLALPASAGAGGMLGANKFDLLEQYLGYASGGDGSAAQTKVTRAMGRKAILDAQSAGFGFLRVSVSGYFPVVPNGARKDALLLWQSNPAAFWSGIDAMLADLDAAKLRLVPTLMWTEKQFPALAGETSSDLIRNPHSISRALFDRFVTQFVTRTRGRRTILFDELTNELNLQADLALNRLCRTQNHGVAAGCVSDGDFGTADLESFAHDAVALIRGIDPARAVSSGYGLPRPSATHLAQRPDWSAGGADWTADSAEEFRRNLLETQRDFSVVSIHVYPQDARFAKSPAELIRFAGDIVHAAGKKLFVGEFGDTTASPFMRQALAAVEDGAADYGAIWIWEFYQSSTFATGDTGPSSYTVEPGLRGGILGLLRPPPEAAEPQVVLTWPLPCADVSRKITLAATASDGVAAPEAVTFLVDGKSVGRLTVPPYRVMFDPAGLGGKLATVEVRAQGHAGGMASDRSEVRLNAPDAACTVASADAHRG